MNETPNIVSRVRRTHDAQPKDFTFTSDLMRLPASISWLAAYRQKAWETFKALPLPTTQDEAWRRTDLKSLRADTYHIPAQDAYLDLPPVDPALLQPLTGDAHGGQVVLVPGGSQVELNEDLQRQGVIFTDLRTAETQYPQILEKVMGQVIATDEGKFAALAGALAQNGVLLYVPKGVTVEQPLQSIFWGPGTSLAHVSHLLVYLDEGSSATYVHESASPTESGQSLHTGIVEIYVGPEARLQFVELQSWGEHVWSISHERAKVDRGANLDWIFGAVGSHLTKNFTELNLVGAGSTGRMSGFYFTDNDQHLDHDTQQNHLAEHTTSDLLFKGALMDNSRSVWQGMIYVAPGAQKTDGYQANRNLVLSRKARADSIPGLEILADDVRCTHGATVGRIDQDQVFYLMARGIERVEAERLIVEGFFDPIMQRIPFEGVRERFQQAIHNKMNTYAGR